MSLKVAKLHKADEAALIRKLISLLCPPVDYKWDEQIADGGDKLWRDAAMPPASHGPNITTPKPDQYCGYPRTVFSRDASTTRILNEHIADYARLNDANYFPFLVMDFRAQGSAGDSFWLAENQAAGAGTLCVSALRKFSRLTLPGSQPLMQHTVVFFRRCKFRIC